MASARQVHDFRNDLVCRFALGTLLQLVAAERHKPDAAQTFQIWLYGPVVNGSGKHH